MTPEDRRAALVADVRHGLTATPKSLPPTWFYDEAGSRLYDEITRLPEYYLTRTEAAILAGHAGAIVARSGAGTLVEVGSGTSAKTRLLLDAMAAQGRLRSVVLLDISAEVLRSAAESLARDYGVEVHAVAGDFRSDLSQLSSLALGDGRSLWAFLGSTIGNVVGPDRTRLLAAFRAAMAADDVLLLGTDLVKSPERLVAAYDDAAGVTARFDLNLLAMLNRELHATFDLSRFEHVARWNAARRWIEIRLRSATAQVVEIADLGMTVTFAAGEDILTELCAKFDPDDLAAELAAAGLVTEQVWRDGAGDFQVTLARGKT